MYALLATVVATCVRLPADSGLEWQVHRRDGRAAPPGRPADTFYVEHCPGQSVRGSMIGDIVVRRLQLCEQERAAGATIYDDNPNSTLPLTLDGDMFASAGPDELRVTLSGPELVVVPLQHEGGCVYRFSYRVVLPGLYHVRAFLLSRGFDAVTHGSTPPAQVDDILGTGAFLQLGQAVGVADSELRRLHESVLTARGLPPCEAGSPHPGRWVSRLSPDSALAPLPVPTPRDPTHCSRSWRFTDLTQVNSLTWVPYDCARRTFTPEQKVECLADKRVLFQGESHARYLLRSLLSDVVTKGELAHVAYNQHAYMRKCVRTAGTGVACFSWDPHAKALPNALSPPPPQRSEHRRGSSARHPTTQQRRLQRLPQKQPQRTPRTRQQQRQQRAIDRRHQQQQPRPPRRALVASLAPGLTRGGRPQNLPDAGAGGTPSAPWDFVALSVGSWMSGGVSLRAANRTIHYRVAAAAARLPNVTTLLWWTPQAGPVPGGCKMPERTYVPMRLLIMRGMAQATREAVAATRRAYPHWRREGGIRIGDIMPASEAMLEFSTDGAHLAMPPYQDLLIDELLGTLCPLQ